MGEYRSFKQMKKVHCPKCERFQVIAYNSGLYCCEHKDVLMEDRGEIKVDHEKNISLIAKAKVCLLRSSTYLVIINYLMLIFIFIGDILSDINIMARVVLTAGGLLLALVVGYIDIKLKMFNNEQNYISTKNDMFMEMYHGIKRLERK